MLFNSGPLPTFIRPGLMGRDYPRQERSWQLSANDADGLAPRSRTSSFALRGRPRNVRELGKQLADAVGRNTKLRLP